MGAENNVDMEEGTLEIGMGMLSSDVPYLLVVHMIVQTADAHVVIPALLPFHSVIVLYFSFVHLTSEFIK